MKCANGKLLTLAVALLIEASTLAQNPLGNIGTMGFGDVAVIKQRAVAGDAQAQVQLGNSLASSFHATEALDWYRKAANQGSVEARYEVGKILLFGAPGIPNGLTVHPQPIEGARWTFAAATNLYPDALWNMSKAYRQGLGVETNLVAAYVWLKLFSETTRGSIVGRVEMNDLALKLDTGALTEAENLVVQFRSGRWPTPAFRVFPEGDSRLKLNGISFGTKTPLAVLNGRTLAQGESATIHFKAKTVTIKCVAIDKDFVSVLVEGEDEPRTLRLK
jgi:hypothetical protein